jgi:hypothetical protein
MKKILLATAVLAGFAAAPALAADPNPPVRSVVLPPAAVGPAIMGYAGVGAAFGRLCDSGGGCADAWTAAAGGALNVPLSGNLNIEIEAVGANIHMSGGTGPGSADLAYGRGILHGYMRNQAWAFGIYGGFENPTAVGIWTIGGEAQAYLGNITLYGQVATNSVTIPGGDHSSFWSARGSAQLFLGQNVVVQGDIRYVSDFLGEGVGGGGSAVPATTFGGTIEGRMMGSPWSAFATVRHTTFDTSTGIDPVTAGLVGFRAHVGAMSLFQQYHQGASMNTVPFL